MALVVAVCAVSACAPPTLREWAQSAGGAVEAATAAMSPSQRSSGDPLLDFLADAGEGEIRELDDSATSGRLRVTAGRVYHAASGRLCRRYTATSSVAPETHEKGLACEDAKGFWDRAGLLDPISP